MAKTFCVVKKNAIALVGIPTYFPRSTEKEVIGWNAGRLYGKIQLSHLFVNWKQGIFSRNYKSHIWISNSLYLHFLLWNIIMTTNLNVLQCLIVFLVLLIFYYLFFQFSVHTDAIERFQTDDNKNETIEFNAYHYQPLYILQKP